ncbi:MAG: hypothetical protein CBC12_00355 [Candidatus Puniceispirillum sp. TMED52]|nr:MAG: hypothetical protein CBC12_00355 [Candidatus Puniceispirillum sp. TMED52]
MFHIQMPIKDRGVINVNLVLIGVKIQVIVMEVILIKARDQKIFLFLIQLMLDALKDTFL